MNESTASDAELLAAWVTLRRESAFHALVVRYAGLVHMASKRACGDDSLAADASQLVFIQLAQKAKSLLGHPSLAGWLHVTAVLKTRELFGKNQRETRKRNQFQSAMETESITPQDGVWQEIQPHLNDALDSLSKNDREAILLRFYRSLSVREIAATLGIATDAAQKRLDRATERLREKLTRRGITTTASLSAVMLAGFSADANAAVISTSVLSSKAIAASATSTNLIAALLAMKATTYIAPAVVLLCGGLFFNSQSQAISRVEKEIAETRAAIAAQEQVTATATASSAVKPAGIIEKMDAGSLDWIQIARKLEQTSLEGRENSRILRDLNQRIGAMSREELIAACDEIAKLGCSQEIQTALENLVVTQLASVDPDYVLGRFWEARRQAGKGNLAKILEKAFGQWAKGDLEKAAAWMDTQIAAGAFASNNASGYDGTFITYERSLARGLWTKNPEAFAQRLSAMPPSLRTEVMLSIPRQNDSVDSWVALAKLARSLAPEEDQARLIGGLTWSVEFDQHSLPKLVDYFQQVAATAEERSKAIHNLTRLYSTTSGENRTPTREDYDAIRTWIARESPTDVDSFTGIKLMRDRQNESITFEQGAEIVRHYHDEGASDEIIRNYLLFPAPGDRAKLPELAAKIRDPKFRAKVLQDIQK